MKEIPLHKNNLLDEKYFEVLFKSHFSALCSFALKYINDLDSAKEITHDIFINLWEKRLTIDLNKSIKSYLYTSVYNRCMNHIRDNKKFRQVDTAGEAFDENWDPSGKMGEAELDEKIHQTIDSLPVKCREIFLLNRFEELKYHEIAAKLEISVKTVEAQMSKALKILRENLAEYIRV